MRLPRLPKPEDELHGQFTFYFAVTVLAHLLVWSFYYILLLRSSNNSVWVVTLDYIAVVFGQITAYIFGAVVMSKVGYLKLYRMSAAILALTTALIFVFMNDILEVHVVLSLLRGVGAGIFWSVNNVMSLREFQGQNRSNTFSINIGVANLLEIVIPVLAGSLITANGYSWIFVIGFFVYFTASIYPWVYNKAPRDTLSVKDILAGTKQSKFQHWARITFISGLTDSMRTIVFLVLPFLLIGQELGVGALSTFVAIIGTFFIFTHRKDELDRKMKFGYIGGFILAVSNVILLIFWSLPWLIIRQVVTRFGFALYDPAIASVEYHNRQALLGDFLDADAVEMQTIYEFLLFLARCCAVFVFVICFFLLEMNQTLILQIFLGISMFREIWLLYVNRRLQQSLMR